MAETVTQITQPPEFIEAAAKPYLTELQQAVGQFKKQDLSKILGPQFVAGQDPLQQRAQALATQGIWGLSTLLTISCCICRTYWIPTIHVSISTRCN